MALKQVSNTKPRSARGAKVVQARSGIPSDASLCASGVAVIETEARALSSLAARVGLSFSVVGRLSRQQFSRRQAA